MGKEVISGEDEHYHNIIKNSINGIILHRLVRNQEDENNHLILEINKTFQKLTGLCSDEVVGKSFSDVFEDTVILEKFKQLESTPKTIRFEGYFPQFHKHLEIFTFPSGNDEYATVFTDISHRKYSERRKKEIEKELTSRLEQQSALSEISQLTLSSLSLEEIMQETMRIVAEALSVDYSKVLRFIPADHELEMEAGVGWDDPHISYRVPADLDSQAGYTLMSEKPVVVEDLSLETRFSGPQLLIDHQVTSGVSVIIGQLEDPYGVMGVHTIAHHIFSPYDVEFLQSVANVLASIINQHQISQELEKSEMRYRLLTENASDMISTHYLDTKYTYASPYSLELIGYLPEELEGNNASLFIHPEDLKNVEKTQEEILTTKKVTTVKYRLKHKNGNYVWVESTARLLNPESGEMIVLTRDISERIRAEEELKRSEAKYRTIFENTGTVIAIIEPDGMVTVLNHKFQEVFGIPPEEVVGKKKWYDFIYKDDVEVMIEFQRKRLAGDKDLPGSYDFRFWDVKGNLKHAFINVDLIPGTENILASISDVTSLKETESKLKEELSITKSLARIYTPLVTPDSSMEQIGQAVLGEAKKLTKSKYGYVSSTDQGTTQQWGYGSKNTLVDCQADLVAPHWNIEQDEPYPGLWGYCLNTREAFFTNSPQSHPSSQGTPPDHVPLKNFLSVPVLLGDQLVGQIALANSETPYHEEDAKAITRLAEFFALAIQKKRSDDKIRNSLKDKEILLQEIHHRVKNNMQIISSLLNLQSSFINDPEAIDVFRESQNRVKSMALLHENLYQSRDMDKVDFRQYVKKLTDNLLITYSTSSSYIQKEIKVENVKLNIETAIPCGLIINELLTNSLKYAFPPGEKGRIYLKIYSKEDKYVLLLGDDGVGLPENFNLESTQTLGLRLVHNLVNQIDGQLKIRPSKGTCFEIVFKELQYKKRI